MSKTESGVGGSGAKLGENSAESSYYTWVDQHNTFGLGEDVPMSTGNLNDGLIAMKDGKIGLSLGCRGDRATGALGYGDVRVTMTTEQLIKALDGCDTVEKNNILYPYNPTCLYKSAF